MEMFALISSVDMPTIGGMLTKYIIKIGIK